MCISQLHQLITYQPKIKFILIELFQQVKQTAEYLLRLLTIILHLLNGPTHSTNQTPLNHNSLIKLFPMHKLTHVLQQVYQLYHMILGRVLSFANHQGNMSHVLNNVLLQPLLHIHLLLYVDDKACLLLSTILGLVLHMQPNIVQNETDSLLYLTSYISPLSTVSVRHYQFLQDLLYLAVEQKVLVTPTTQKSIKYF